MPLQRGSSTEIPMADEQDRRAGITMCRDKIARESSSRSFANLIKVVKLFPCAKMLYIYSRVYIVDFVHLSTGSVGHRIIHR